MDTTTIEISVENWQRLNGRKRPGESFNDVVSRVLDNGDSSEDSDSAAELDAPSGETGAGLEELDFPQGREREACVAAVEAARDHLQEDGPAAKSEIVTAIMPAHDLGYDADAALAKIDEGERFRGAWWRRVVKPGLEALYEIEKPGQGASDWRYVESGK